MALTHVDVIVLGLLAEEPLYGYQLLERYRSRAMELWAEVGRASVYQALRRLERDGLVPGKAQGGQGRPGAGPAAGSEAAGPGGGAGGGRAHVAGRVPARRRQAAPLHSVAPAGPANGITGAMADRCSVPEIGHGSSGGVGGASERAQ